MNPQRRRLRAGYLLVALIACAAITTSFVLLVQAAPITPREDLTPQVALPILFRDVISSTLAPSPTPRPGGCSEQPGDNPLLEWDADLDTLETVHFVTATVAVGELYWRLICAQWYLPGEGPGPNHTILIDTLDESGVRELAVKIRVTFFDNTEFYLTEDKAERYALDKPMFHTLGTYAAQPDTDLPADVVQGMGTGLFPGEGTHTSFLLIWQRTQFALPEPTVTPTATATISGTPTITASPTVTGSPTVSATPTITTTPTVTATPTVTGSPTITGTPTITVTATITPSPTITESPTITASPTMTASPTITSSPTITASPSVTSTPETTQSVGSALFTALVDWF